MERSRIRNFCPNHFDPANLAFPTVRDTRVLVDGCFNIAVTGAWVTDEIRREQRRSNRKPDSR
jgi:hypothetical protein